jgi:hypothetical protein
VVFVIKALFILSGRSFKLCLDMSRDVVTSIVEQYPHEQATSILDLLQMRSDDLYYFREASHTYRPFELHETLR